MARKQGRTTTPTKRLSPSMVLQGCVSAPPATTGLKQKMARSSSFGAGGSPSKPKLLSGLPKTWGEIKALIDAKISDDSRIYMIDIGPNVDKVFVSTDEAGVEITDHPSLLDG